MTRHRATTVGLSAVLLWSSLATLAVWTEPVPPFLLTTVCFAIGGMAGLAWIAVVGRMSLLVQVPIRAYALITAGLFSAHLFYFAALRLAPAAEAALVEALWPLLVVLLSGLLPGERLRPRHVGGAILALAGVGLAIGWRTEAIDPAALPGLGFGLLGSVTWAVYSVGSRRLAAVPTEAVAVACLATAVLSALAHLLFEGLAADAWPSSAGSWAATVLIGLGPAGLAFFAWDVGMKRGNIQLLGVAANLAPLLSTLALVLAGEAEPRGVLALGALLVVLGAAIAAGAGRRRAVRDGTVLMVRKGTLEEVP